MLLLLLGAAGQGAKASNLIDRNAHSIRLQVNGKGEALITYSAAGRLRHVLAWGAVNALAPTTVRPQIKFKLDYAGGWGKYHTLYWKSFQNRCRPYNGPALVYLVTACTAPDGSYWALQAWPVPLPDLGFTPWLPSQSAIELHLSHWTGHNLAVIEVHNDWVYAGMWQGFFGRVTYNGQPVFGFKADRYGAPLDQYERLLYLDTFDSVYGTGWRRENSFLSHNPTGMFCYGFYPFNPLKGGYQYPPGYNSGPRGPGVGSQYRLSLEGPGVTPDVSVVWSGLHPFDKSNPADLSYQAQAMQTLASIIGSDKTCRSGHSGELPSAGS